MVWDQLEHAAVPFYETVRKVEFSPRTYNELLASYEQKLQGASSEEDLLHDVACEWLNGVDDEWPDSRNYEKWTDMAPGHGQKKKLRIGAIFPLEGNRYVAPELIEAMTLALEDIKHDNTTLVDYELWPVIKDGQCNLDMVMQSFIDIITNIEYEKSYVGILGK